MLGGRSSDGSRRFTGIKYHRINQSPNYSLFCWRAERSDRKRIAFQRTDQIVETFKPGVSHIPPRVFSKIQTLFSRYSTPEERLNITPVFRSSPTRNKCRSPSCSQQSELFTHAITFLSRGILLIGCTPKPTNEIRPLLFFSIKGETKAEPDLKAEVLIVDQVKPAIVT